MPEIFSGDSRIQFNKWGNQILSWIWKHPVNGETLEILAGYDHDEPFFLSGSFLMYPWVNRHTAEFISLGEESISLKEIGIKDSKGYPSHGLAYSWKRKIIEQKENSILFELCVDDSLKETCLGKVRVREEYSIRKISEEEILTLRTSFLNQNQFSFQFCYGYHPYFRMKSQRQNPFLRSNIKKQIPLREDLIPIYPIYSRETDRFELDSIPKLDSLFHDKEPWILLSMPDDSYQVRIQSILSEREKISLSYIQVYTDFSHDRIAIEPMSAPGDAVLHGFSLTNLLPEEEKSGCFQILLSPM
ncbi:aldose 1-epimerase [Leptospira sp. WS92.C1]